MKYYKMVAALFTTTLLLQASITSVIAQVPTVTTLPVDSVTPFRALVPLIVLPNASSAQYWVEYGTTTNFTAPTFTYNTTSAITNAVNIQEVVAGTTYYYRVGASNPAGTAYGEILTVTIPQYFAPQPHSIPALQEGKTLAADFNNDGRMDLLVNGSQGLVLPPVTQIWTNNGAAGFSLFLSLPATYNGDVATADYDNDGWMDLLLTGLLPSDEPTTMLFRNLGGTNFVHITNSLPSLYSSAISWGDADGDGRRDLLLTGRTGTIDGPRHTQVWRNAGNGEFARMNIPLPQLDKGHSRFYDIDYDGDLDIALSGASLTNGFVCQIWRNAGRARFTNMNANLPQFVGSFAFHNTDFSGPADPILIGETSTGPIADMWAYDSFSDQFYLVRNLTPLRGATAVLTEVDSVNTPDLIYTGDADTSTPSTNIIIKMATSHLLLVDRGMAFPGVAEGSMVTADFDGDLGPDFFLQGRGPNGSATNYLLKGYVEYPAFISGPSGLTSVVSSNRVTLSWTPFYVSFTASNLRVGTTPGGSDVVSPGALPEGKLLSPAFENLSKAGQFVLRGLPAGTYYWSVQSVLSRSDASQFAPEQTFTITQSPVPSISSVTQTNGSTAIRFNDAGHGGYSVLVSTNLSQWYLLGNAEEVEPGIFGYSDSQTPAAATRFYQIRMP